MDHNFISIMKKNWHRILTVLLTRLSYENQVYAHYLGGLIKLGDTILFAVVTVV